MSDILTALRRYKVHPEFLPRSSFFPEKTGENRAIKKTHILRE